MPSMHEYTDETEALARSIVAYARGADRRPTRRSTTRFRPRSSTGARGERSRPTASAGTEALRLWSEVLAPATLSPDHPGFLAFVPGAPTKASVLFDLAVSASATYAGSWLEGAGAVWAENQVLAWLAALAGIPEGAGGVFVSGGTAGNLSALVAARHTAAAARALGVRRGRPMEDRVRRHRAFVGDLGRPRDGRRRARGPARRARPAHGRGARRVARRRRAPTACSRSSRAPARRTPASSTTSTGVADVCARAGLWLHVDGAYGGGGAARAERPRHRSAGSSSPTRSSSTRTNGCSRRTTRARCSTGIRRSRARRTGRTPRTSTR